MTLIVTEVSKEGVAMVADSMISFQIGKQTISQELWKKLFRVEVAGLPAGISFWGNIGDITTEFKTWFNWKLAEAPRTDLRSFAEYLADQANRAAGNKLVSKEKSAGFHVAGFHPWSDGVSRQTFFHIHNGHVSSQATALYSAVGSNSTSNLDAAQTVPTGGLSSDPELKEFIRDAKLQGAKIKYSDYADARKQFEVHADFPSTSKTLEANLAELDIGHVTRNGDHLNDALIEAGVGVHSSSANKTAIAYVSEAPPTIDSRLRVLIKRLTLGIEQHAAINKMPLVGGPISTLVIRPDGNCHEGTVA